jgi:hypothetical protein
MGGQGPGSGRIGALEASGARCEGIECWRGVERVAVASEVVATQGVERDEEDVVAFRLRRPARDDECDA